MLTVKELDEEYAKTLISRGIPPDMELGGEFVEFESDSDPKTHVNVLEMAGVNSKITQKELNERYKLINELFNSTDK
ncbi:Uncharacterised protein [Anaerostipes hadrus]|uniref:Uncharacterized protein n=1 Tax=Anaerostipes hadrus TaxID=649756 RepID=A0A174JB74_ANAHA|nr:hypothetical protein [Anaerostipes hadrus]CUO96893.1 Uncharacterised protein [Anaerostipes hadrus]